MADDDPFSLIDYRRLIDWPTRLAREWPFFARALADAPSRRILDLGCGPGEHARLFVSHGFEVVGIDASEAQLANAREQGESAALRFIKGDIADVEALTEGTFGAAICVGNTLPSVPNDERMSRLADGLRRRLLPGARWVTQILNYDRVAATRQRALPVNVLPDEDGELVFLRLMDPKPDGRVIFTPAMLRYRSGGDPPLELLAARHADMRGWRLAELEPILRAAGFDPIEALGGIDGAPFDAEASSDLVLVARSPKPKAQSPEP